MDKKKTVDVGLTLSHSIQNTVETFGKIEALKYYQSLLSRSVNALKGDVAEQNTLLMGENIGRIIDLTDIINKIISKNF